MQEYPDEIEVHYDVSLGCFRLRDGTQIRNLHVVNLDTETFGATNKIRYLIRAEYDPPSEVFIDMTDVIKEIESTFVNRM